MTRLTAQVGPDTSKEHGDFIFKGIEVWQEHQEMTDAFRRITPLS